LAFFVCGFTVAAVLDSYRQHKGGLMRQFPLWLCILLVLPVSATPRQRAKPPGIVTADPQSNQPIEAPMEMRSRKLNVEQVKYEADD
jgi:hypothetical protein